MKKQTDCQFRQDTDHEGREKAYMDIDRMINEGLAGGVVHQNKLATNIEEAHELQAEEPPHIT